MQALACHCQSCYWESKNTHFTLYYSNEPMKSSIPMLGDMDSLIWCPPKKEKEKTKWGNSSARLFPRKQSHWFFFLLIIFLWLCSLLCHISLVNFPQFFDSEIPHETMFISVGVLSLYMWCSHLSRFFKRSVVAASKYLCTNLEWRILHFAWS